MIAATAPQNETGRLKALAEYNILDTLPEAEFDDITLIASEICGVPISLITLVDEKRQWFKSHHGLDVLETPRDQSFCAHAINTPGEIFMVPDAKNDERFSDNPLVTGDPYIVFYAGVPLVNPEGLPLGTLCVIDRHLKKLNKGQLQALQSLGRQVVSLLELKRNVLQLNQKQKELEDAYEDLEKFSYIASHDLKSPLNNIISLATLLTDLYEDKLDEEGNEYLGYITDSANQLTQLVDGILEYSKSSKILVSNKETIIVSDLIKEILALINVPKSFKVSYKKDKTAAVVSVIALRQILMNIITNAIKYHTGPKGKIDIEFQETRNDYIFEISDDGPGIDPEDQEKIFDLFERLKNTIRKKEGTGIGLSTVKRIVERLGGTIKLESALGRGAKFIITLPK